MTRLASVSIAALTVALGAPAFAQDAPETIPETSADAQAPISAIAATPEEDQAVGQRLVVNPEDLPEPYQGAPVANAPLTAADEEPSINVPDGFTATLFARGLEGPRQGHVLPNGDLLVSMQQGGYITLLRDSDGDGTADIVSRAFEPFQGPYGITHREWTGEGDHDYEILIADQEGIWSLGYTAPDVRAVGARNMTVDEAPQDIRNSAAYDFSGQELLTESMVWGEPVGHTNRDIAIGQDGRLYVGVGSMGNISEEPEPKLTIQSFAPDGTDQQTVASGLRNPCGLDIHPDTGALYAVVQERDGAGDNLVPDFVTEIQDGGFYGFPYAYVGPNPQPGFADRAPDMVEATIVPDLLLNPHSAGMDMAFYTGDAFPERFQNGAFVALKGSWNRTQPTGYKVVFVPFENGSPAGGYENFMTGFWVRGTERAEVWGRPSDVTMAPDGSLYVVDDTGGTIWRITYDGDTSGEAESSGDSGSSTEESQPEAPSPSET